jgi:hypothetical protein
MKAALSSASSARTERLEFRVQHRGCPPVQPTGPPASAQPDSGVLVQSLVNKHCRRVEWLFDNTHYPELSLQLAPAARSRLQMPPGRKRSICLPALRLSEPISKHESADFRVCLRYHITLEHSNPQLNDVIIVIILIWASPESVSQGGHRAPPPCHHPPRATA